MVVRLSLVMVLGISSVAHAQLVEAPQVQGLRFADARHDDEGWLRLARVRSGTRVGAPTEATARAVVHSLADAIHPEPIGLRHQRTLRAHGYTVVRFVREVWGLPLLGSSVIVRFRGDELDFVAFDLGARAGEDPGPAIVDAPLASAVRATRWVRARPIGHELVAFADDAGMLRKTWRVEVEGALHERADVLMDASDGRVIAIVPRLLHQLGRVYDPNPVLSPDPTDEELDNLTSARFLTGRYARVQSCRPAGVSECVTEQRAESSGGNWLFDPEEPAYDDEFAEVNIYFHTNRVAEYFRDAHSFEWTCCGTSNIMDAIANYVETPGVSFRNAFFSPSSCGSGRCALMAFGQSSTKDFGYDGDVVYHEYGHGIVDVTAGLSFFDVDPLLGVGYENGALNEGTADYFSATITGDPKLADYFAGSGMAAGEGGLRELDVRLRCPDDLFGEAHADGRIWGGALWAVREAIGAVKADALAFATLMSLGDGPDIDTAGTSLSMTAATFPTLDDADRAAVEAVIADRGLVGCRRIVPVVPGETYTGYSGDVQLSGFLGGGVVPLHYAVDVPADALAVRIRLDSLTLAGQYDVYVRNGEPARYRGAGTPRLIADDVFPGVGLVRMTRTTEHAIPACDTLYFAIVATDLTTRGPSVYELTVEIDTDADLECPEPELDASMPDGASADAGADAALDAGSDAGIDVGGGGCGCRLAPAQSRSGLAFGLAVLMVLAWRRRK